MSKNRFVVFPKSLENYKLEIMLNNYCKSIVPASQRDGERGKVVEYHLKGYIPAEVCLSPAQAMKLLYDACIIIEELEDYLFFSGQYQLRVENLYYNPSKDRYQIVICAPEGEERSQPYEVLLEEVQRICTSDCHSYINEIREYERDYKPDSCQLKRFIAKKEDEIYQCGI